MSRKFRFVSLLLLVTAIFMPFASDYATAQAARSIECGQTIESVFTSNGQTHEYSISVEAGTKMIIYAESQAQSYENLEIEAGMWAPNGYEINELSGHARDRGRWDTIVTHFVSAAGEYDYNIRAWTSTGAAYLLTVSCVDGSASVNSSSHLTQGLRCGDIIENTMLLNNQYHRYYIFLNQGDKTKIVATTNITEYESLEIEGGMWAPNGYEINELSGHARDRGNNETIETEALPVSGVYGYALRGWTSTSGNYQLTVGCTLADGTVINPGDQPPVDLTAQTSSTVSTPQIFSGFGFPGVPSVDFSEGIEIPLTAGQPQTASVGNDITLYTYEATTGQTATLNVSRIGGDISIGVSVINRDTNTIVFLGGMPYSNNLTTQLTFPTDGTYAIGLFRLDTSELQGTSGAVQVTIE